MLLYSKNIDALIQDDITLNPPRLHALTKRSESEPAYLTESQPLAWASLFGTTQLSDMHLHVKLADLGAGNASFRMPSW
jgi:hypothetical protein